MNWPQRRIGDYLTESAIETSMPSVERRIRVRLNAEGIEKRPLIAETEGATRYFQRKAGQFIYGKQNLHKGAFGVVPPELDGFESSSDLPAFDVADGLRPEWLEYFLKQGNFYKSLVAIAKGAATKRIQPEALFAVELPVPPPKVQDEIIKRMDLCATEHAKLEHEITHQQTLLAKLKQAILQEAIQGKLTANWRAAHPDVEPASQLLQRIQAEKARLIAAKELRPEKPLTKITPAEIPFEIPKNWEWCRLGVVTRFFDYRGKTPNKISAGVRLITAKNVKFGWFSDTPRDYLSEESYRRHMVRGFPDNGDILLTTEAPLGNACQLEMDEPYALGQRLITIQPLISNKRFFLFAMLSSVIQSQLIAKASGITAKGIKSSRLIQVLIPLPPLAEQEAIVDRVEVLMTSSRALEAEIEHTRTNAAQLLQAVLKEAFTSTA